MNDVTTLSESSDKKGNDDGESRSIDFSDPDGGGKRLDDLGDGSGVGHTLDESRDERLNIRVGEDMTESDSSLESTGSNLRRAVTSQRATRERE